MATDETLRREVDELGRLFGETIRRYSGEAAFNNVEAVPLAARRFNEGQPGAVEEMDRLLGGLTEEELRVVVEAFSTFLELANIAEDRQRVRACVLRNRTNRRQRGANRSRPLSNRCVRWAWSPRNLNRFSPR